MGLLEEPLGAGVVGALPGDVLGVLNAAVAAEGLGAQEPETEIGSREAFKGQTVSGSRLEVGAEFVVEVEGVGDVGTGPQRGVTHLGTMQLATQVVIGGVILGLLAQQLMAEAEAPARGFHLDMILLDEPDVLKVVPCAVLGLGIWRDA